MTKLVLRKSNKSLKCKKKVVETEEKEEKEEEEEAQQKKVVKEKRQREKGRKKGEIERNKGLQVTKMKGGQHYKSHRY